MILAIDIGNTNIVLGGFVEEEPSFVARIATDSTKTEDEYAAKIRSVLGLHEIAKAQIEGAVISSVVPPLDTVMQKAVKTVYGVDALMVRPDLNLGIGIECDNPMTVGADLICACVAAYHLYQSPSLIVDMGTATKMMMVSGEGNFVGVSIIPGVQIALKALASGAALLSQISLEAPPSVLGKNTVDCMRSGVVFGNASMIDGMIDRFREEAGEPLFVLATGGLAATVIPHCKQDILIDENLVLKGLYILYQKNS